MTKFKNNYYYLIYHNELCLIRAEISLNFNREITQFRIFHKNKEFTFRMTDFIEIIEEITPSDEIPNLKDLKEKYPEYMI